MFKRYSLKKRLITYISVFSVVLGCVLVLEAYRISLRELDEILDAQMVYLAERVALNVHPIQSQFNEHKHYHEEDLFIDVWAYADHSDVNHKQHMLVSQKD